MLRVSVVFDLFSFDGMSVGGLNQVHHDAPHNASMKIKPTRPRSSLDSLGWVSGGRPKTNARLGIVAARKA